MSPLPNDRKTDTCTDCGAIYWRTERHFCARTQRLRMSDAYVSQQMRGLAAQFERPSGRHARRGPR